MRGAFTTFNQLVPSTHCDEERQKTKRLLRGISAHILFLGLKNDPREHGFDEANYWIYKSLDHDSCFDRSPDHPADRSSAPEIRGAFVSFGSLRNPGQHPHTAQVICFTDGKEWADFKDTHWMHRGEEYEQKKQVTTEAMLDFANSRMPGLREIVDYSELATPLTVK